MSKNNRIVILDKADNRYVFGNLSVEKSELNHSADILLKEVDNYNKLLSDTEVLNADILICWYSVPLQADLIQLLTKCKAIIRPAVGFENIDVNCAKRCNIPVINIPDYGTEEVADHTLALILAASRNLLCTDQSSKHTNWDWKSIGTGTSRLRGKKVGIIGLGRIGKSVALRLKVFGLEISFYDPYEKSGIDKSLGINEVCDFKELIEQSDIISFHVPLNGETKDMINEENYSWIKNYAIVVNTCRGGVISQTALEKLIDNSSVRLALDVLPDEPNVPNSLKNNRVILTSHSAFYTKESLEELKRKAIRRAMDILESRKIKDVINA